MYSGGGKDYSIKSLWKQQFDLYGVVEDFLKKSLFLIFVKKKVCLWFVHGKQFVLCLYINLKKGLFLPHWKKCVHHVKIMKNNCYGDNLPPLPPIHQAALFQRYLMNMVLILLNWTLHMALKMKLHCTIGKHYVIVLKAKSGKFIWLQRF